VYSPDVCVFRDIAARGYAWLHHPFSVDVVSVAAYKNPCLTPVGQLAPDVAKRTVLKIKGVLMAAVYHGNDAVVLGALGCGAFHNPPRHVAALFQRVLAEVLPMYPQLRVVTFAILEDANSVKNRAGGNIAPFTATFHGKGPALSVKELITELRVGIR